MARPRKNERSDLPKNLYYLMRSGKEYYSYRNPLTRKSISLGFDISEAILYASDANRKMEDLLVSRGDPSTAKREELMSYESILDKSVDASKFPGVYFLFQGDNLVYVGQSTDTQARIGQHRSRQQIPFDRVSVIHCSPSDLLLLESRYIRKFTPFYNISASVLGELNTAEF